MRSPLVIGTGEPSHQRSIVRCTLSGCLCHMVELNYRCPLISRQSQGMHGLVQKHWSKQSAVACSGCLYVSIAISEATSQHLNDGFFQHDPESDLISKGMKRTSSWIYRHPDPDLAGAVAALLGHQTSLRAAARANLAARLRGHRVARRAAAACGRVERQEGVHGPGLRRAPHPAGARPAAQRRLRPGKGQGG